MNQACGRTLKWTIATLFSPSLGHCKAAGPSELVVITDSHLVHKIQHNAQLQNVRRADSRDIAMASQPVSNSKRKDLLETSAVQVWRHHNARKNRSSEPVIPIRKLRPYLGAST